MRLITAMATSHTSRVMIARPTPASGVLSIPASATLKKSGPTQQAQPSRGAGARLKVVIRRLPPGLDQSEFEETLGKDWKSTGDRVDWAIYKPGKVSKEYVYHVAEPTCYVSTLFVLINHCSPAKPSRPSRAYLHLRKQEYLASLSEKVRDSTFSDTKGSSKDSSLLGPPIVEFAPYGRAPSSRPRKDARQGTIDQDPEFIDFLESLTNPIARTAPVDPENDTTGKSKDKVTVTPLIQFLRDKKANKFKESASPAKNAKNTRPESKDNKSATVAEAKSANNTKIASLPGKRSAQAVKVEQAARDAVKVLNKQAAIKGAAPASPSTVPVVPNSTATSALADKRRERGSASAAAKILQRDLGLDRNAGGRGGRRGLPANAARPSAANATSARDQDTGSNQASIQARSTPTLATNAAVPESPTATKSAVVPPPLGPAALRNPAKATTPTEITTPISHKPTPPTSTSTQAFLKHANPSQGITEPLLEEAFAIFGSISKVEIDKKKGFAYVDFADPESLQKAMKASPIKVAQGQVVVLERKTGPSLQARNMRGGGPMVGNRGGGMSVGGRGGPMRGHGGFGRGGANMPNANTRRSGPATANATSTQLPAAAQVPTAPSTTAEESSTPSPSPVPPPSTLTSSAV